MCFQDVEIARATGASERTVSLSGTSQSIAGPNPFRTWIGFLFLDGDPVHISSQQTADDEHGFRITGANSPIFLDGRLVGDIVGKEWKAAISGGVGSAFITVIEAAAPKEAPNG